MIIRAGFNTGVFVQQSKLSMFGDVCRMPMPYSKQSISPHSTGCLFWPMLHDAGLAPTNIFCMKFAPLVFFGCLAVHGPPSR